MTDTDYDNELTVHVIKALEALREEYLTLTVQAERPFREAGDEEGLERLNRYMRDGFFAQAAPLVLTLSEMGVPFDEFMHWAWVVPEEQYPLLLEREERRTRRTLGDMLRDDLRLAWSFLHRVVVAFMPLFLLVLGFLLGVLFWH